MPMHPKHEQTTRSLVNWKVYLSVTAETMLTFYLATFCMAMFFVHRPANWIILGILMILLYLFVIIVCAKRIYNCLPLSALMLIIPIAPLLALIMVVSLIPIIQFLQ